MRATLLCLLLVLPFIGCSPGPTQSEVSEADAEATAAGVGKEAQVRFFITDELQLDALDLTHTGNGNFTGKGSRQDGIEFDIEITQEKGGIKYTWKNSKGKKGKGSFSY